MSYAFIHDVPADEAMYRQVRALLPTETPTGLIAHLVITREGGLRYLDVWETEADWLRFREDHLDRAVGRVLASMGIPAEAPGATTEDIEIIDVWLGATQSPMARQDVSSLVRPRR